MEIIRRTGAMKAMVIDSFGKDAVMRMADMPDPEARPGDVLGDIYAASINPLDFKIRNGARKQAYGEKTPFIMGNDFAGVVVEGGGWFKKGDMGYSRPGYDRIGTFAEMIAVDARYVAPMPSNLDFIQAAAMPLVGLTSFQAL
jgi:alcohol dehydrogenase